MLEKSRVPGLIGEEWESGPWSSSSAYTGMSEMLISLSVLGLRSTNPGTKSSLSLSLAFPSLPLTASSPPLLAALRTLDKLGGCFGHVCLHTHFEYPGTKWNGTEQRFEFVASRFSILSPRYPVQAVGQRVTELWSPLSESHHPPSSWHPLVSLWFFSLAPCHENPYFFWE